MRNFFNLPQAEFGAKQTVVAADRRFHRPYNRDTIKYFNDGKVLRLARQCKSACRELDHLSLVG